MPAKFVAEEGSLQGLVLPLEDGDQWVIGRDPDSCQLIVEDPGTSRMHVICHMTDEGFTLENLSTTNPTRVNNEEIKDPHLLHNGDLVKIGNAVFRFYTDSSAEDLKDEGPSEGSQDSPEPSAEALDEEGPGEGSQDAPEPSAEALDEEGPSEEGQEEPEQEFTDTDAIHPVSSDIESEEPVPKPNQNLKPEPEGDMTETLIQEPQPVSTQEVPDESQEPSRNSVFDEEPADKFDVAKITFGLLDTGKWLLKVISGPNNGAEFSLQAGSSYILGTDPNICDLIFHDTSVSRQHVRIVITPSDTITIEDLKSRNGTMVDGTRLEGKQTISPNSIIAIGTSSFVIYDREAEMHTIISPLLPAIVKEIIEEPKGEKIADAAKSEQETETEEHKAEAGPAVEKEAPYSHVITLGGLIFMGILTGIFIVAGIGISTLFKNEPVAVEQSVDPVGALNNALSPFLSTVKYTYNKNTGQLLLIGHVLTTSDRNQLLYALQGLKFIKNLDDSGLVIDEGTWREFNQVIEKYPEWRGITIMSPTPGHFVVSGYLHKRTEADRLSEYLNANFPYPDLLEKRVVVDEDVISSVNNLLLNQGYRNIIVNLDNGEITLTGSVGVDKAPELNKLIPEIKKIQGVRNVRNLTTEVGHEESVINISGNYEVTGFSNQGGRLSVIINGRILMPGDSLDGMTITSIHGNVILLEKDNAKYRIDFNR